MKKTPLVKLGQGEYTHCYYMKPRRRRLLSKSSGVSIVIWLFIFAATVTAVYFIT